MVQCYAGQPLLCRDGGALRQLGSAGPATIDRSAFPRYIERALRLEQRFAVPLMLVLESRRLHAVRAHANVTPVSRTRSRDNGVLPSDELEDGEVETIAEFDPSSMGRLIEPA